MRVLSLWSGLMLAGSAFAADEGPRPAAPPARPARCAPVDLAVGRMNWCIDLPVSVAMLGFGMATNYVVLVEPDRTRRSTDAAARWDPLAAHLSDLLSPAGLTEAPGLLAPLFLTLTPALAIGGAYEGDRPGLGMGAATTLVVESVSTTLAVTNVLKQTIGRPRPFTSAAFEAAHPRVRTLEEYREDDGSLEPDAYWSMPSGHTSMTAAAAFSVATLWMAAEVRAIRRRQGERAWSIVFPILAEGAAAGATALVGSLRVQAGVHHVDDTVVGGVLGGVIGVLVPTAHALAAKAPADDLPVAISVSVQPIPGGAVPMVSGVW